MRPQDLLKTRFGYDRFRPLQEDIIQHVLSGKDALVLMPTGGGKSLCYQLPALMFEGLTLVISPLISLMKDQVDALNASGIRAAFINSSLSPDEISRVQASALAGKIKILYLAPERLASYGSAEFLDRLRVSLIAVDEAHCISEWGHDFRPDYRNLQSLRGRFPSAPMLALTATATEKVRMDIARQLRLNDFGPYISSFNRPNLTYIVRPKKNAFMGLVDILERHRKDSAIIYCFSRKATEELAADLRDKGFLAQAYHAGLDARERSQVQERFIRDDARIVTATIAFGMGINKPDVRLVVHYDLPKSIEGYYQETGRAGRDGLPAECVLFFTYADVRKHRYFIDEMEEGPERTNTLTKLNQVIQYGQSQACRRRQLLSYFGEGMPPGPCGGCDVCLPKKSEEPRAIATAAVRSGDAELFEKLRILRKRLADERRVPAYIIFGDRSLKDMAERRPFDRQAFSQVFGVGTAKMDSFADIFLEVINDHVRASHDIMVP